MSRSNLVHADEITKEIAKAFDKYEDDIYDIVVDTVDQVTKEARDELKQRSLKAFGSGKRDKPYYKGWSTKISNRGHSKYHKVIWNATNYQLTHLLEFGHRVYNAKVKKEYKGVEHIRPVEQKYKVEFVDLIEERIRRGGKL